MHEYLDMDTFLIHLFDVQVDLNLVFYFLFVYFSIFSSKTQLLCNLLVCKCECQYKIGKDHLNKTVTNLICKVSCLPVLFCSKGTERRKNGNEIAQVLQLMLQNKTVK